ncbi:M15 family metallopeptidase [Lysobacter sp. 1R34A]|uniref:M15 family metallopeptidase n=1 Tax=Lysobacter sp. 1R34A TaxID=3445786 RepID=UPI003EE8E08D
MKTWRSCGSAIAPGARAALELALVLALSACAAGPAPKPHSVAPQLSPATDAAAAGMVEIRSLVPDISLDIRYAGRDNFIGRPVEGYQAPGCYLHEPVAQALARVERSLRPQGLRLRIYDCYRPVRAVRDFVAWAGDLDDQRSKPQYYPNLDKRVLLGDYISPTSGHSRGATLDLTLLELRDDRFEPMDMGTPFDFFDETANTASPNVDARQRSNRERLREAMRREGFENYPLEWWHYTYKPEPTPQTAFDFPVR